MKRDFNYEMKMGITIWKVEMKTIQIRNNFLKFLLGDTEILDVTHRQNFTKCKNIFPHLHLQCKHKRLVYYIPKYLIASNHFIIFTQR